MIRKILTGSMVILAAALISCSGGPNLKEGKWEITTSMKMAGIKMPTVTYTQCLTKKDFVPRKSEKSNTDCKIIKQTVSGDTVSWTMECDGQGGKMTSTGEITYQGDSFSGTVTTTTMGMKMTGKMSGKLIGKCK